MTLPNFLSQADWETFVMMLGGRVRLPDLTIAPDGKPYLYRWHLVPRNNLANAYLHIQVGDDPKRPLHDHPWDNTSVILSGGYMETRCLGFSNIPGREVLTETVYYPAGTRINRDAEDSHRLELPPGGPYTMTFFTTGPKRRRWGFWYPEGWVDAANVCEETDGVSVHRRK